MKDIHKAIILIQSYKLRDGRCTRHAGAGVPGVWGAGVRGRVGPWLGLHLNRNHVVYVEKSLHVCGCGQGQSRECRRPEDQSIQGRCGEGEKSVLFTCALI